MASNEKNLCSALREEWRLLTLIVRNLQQLLNKLLSRIKAMVNRIINSYLALLAGILRDIKDLIGNILGLSAIDKNTARAMFCRLLYKCKPAMDLVMKKFDKSLYNWIYSTEPYKTPDLSKWGIPSITFNSRYEVFEYVACRLSLNSLYNSFVDTLINQVMTFVSSYKQYLTVEYWLKHTAAGRVLTRFMKDYEDFFNEYVLKYMNMLKPYLDCGFALCDFKSSTSNFFDDFKEKYFIGIDRSKNPLGEFVVFKKDLISNLTSTMNGMRSDLQSLDVMHHGKITPEEAADKDATTNPFTKEEENHRDDNDSDDNTSMVAPATEDSDLYERDVQENVSPGSTVE